jgi:hypothetical protein
MDEEMDGELLAIFAMTRNPSFGFSHSREVGRTILGRIAKYRSQRPPLSSPDHLDANTNTKLQSCLAEALAGQDR